MLKEKFIWGAATSAAQIEGAVLTDGKGLSIWDRFSEIEGCVANGDKPDIACDHYNKYPEDIALMRELGLDAYRLSLSWPRLFPNGIGNRNEAGFDFYNRLVDSLLENNITPWVTLYHWDLPQALQDKGGWINRNILDWFNEYSVAVFSALGDRVFNFFVLNEPSVVCILGHLRGVHAPGLQSKEAYLASSHHQNIVSGRTIAIARNLIPKVHIGSAYTHFPVRPFNKNSTEDVVAAKMVDALWTRIYLDPVFKGVYPALLEKDIQPYIKDNDMKEIAVHPDFVGINHYSPTYATKDESKLFNVSSTKSSDGQTQTDIGWPVDPEALKETLEDIRHNYGNIAVYIAENGACYNDQPDSDGLIRDDRRIDYYKKYIDVVLQSKENGCNIKGYFSWSLMDNFEWAYGYSMRFGLIHIDYNNLKRTPKQSYYWYQDFIKSHK